MNTKIICDLISLAVMCVTNDMPENYSVKRAVESIVDYAGNDKTIDIDAIKQHIEDVIIAVKSSK